MIGESLKGDRRKFLTHKLIIIDLTSDFFLKHQMQNSFYLKTLLRIFRLKAEAKVDRLI